MATVQQLALTPDRSIAVQAWPWVKTQLAKHHVVHCGPKGGAQTLRVVGRMGLSKTIGLLTNAGVRSLVFVTTHPEDGSLEVEVVKGEKSEPSASDVHVATVPQTRRKYPRMLTTDAKATWSAAEVNNLPDSSFAYIAPGGSKDSDGKTTPRALRHLPYKGADGKVDLPHLRNALARLSQTKIPAAAKATARQKLEAAAHSAGVKDDVYSPGDDGSGGGDDPAIAAAEAAAMAADHRADHLAGMPPGPRAEKPHVGSGFRPMKALRKDAQQQILLSVVLEPGVVDSQDDFETAADIEQACHAWMEGYRLGKSKLGLVHERQLHDIEAVCVENYICPVDYTVDSPSGKQQVKKGSWLQAWHVKNPAVWAKCMNGELTGFSIGGDGTRIPAEAAQA